MRPEEMKIGDRVAAMGKLTYDYNQIRINDVAFRCRRFEYEGEGRGAPCYILIKGRIKPEPYEDEVTNIFLLRLVYVEPSENDIDTKRHVFEEVTEDES